MPSAAYFRRQADICLRLSLISSDGEVSNRLIIMAKEYAQPGRRSPPFTPRLFSWSGSNALTRSRAGALRGTVCAAPFFVRSPGRVQIAKSSEISPQVMPATSPRRWPVRSSKRMIVP